MVIGRSSNWARQSIEVRTFSSNSLKLSLRSLRVCTGLSEERRQCLDEAENVNQFH